MLKAKRHSIIDDTTKQLRGFHLSDTFEVYGKKYTMRTLEPREVVASDSFIMDGSIVQASRAMGRARVAFSLVAIDGVPIEQLFEVPKEGDPEDLRMLEDKNILESWRRQQIYEWLVSDTQDEVIAELWTHYGALNKRKQDSMEGLKSFKNGTPSTAPSPT